MLTRIETQWFGVLGTVFSQWRIITNVIGYTTPWLWPLSFVGIMFISILGSILVYPLTLMLVTVMLAGILIEPLWMAMFCFPPFKEKLFKANEIIVNKSNDISRNMQLESLENVGFGIFGTAFSIFRVMIHVQSRINVLWWPWGFSLTYIISVLASLIATPLTLVMLALAVLGILIQPIWICVYPIPLFKTMINEWKNTLQSPIHNNKQRNPGKMKYIFKNIQSV